MPCVDDVLPFGEHEAFGQRVAGGSRRCTAQRLQNRFVRRKLHRADYALIQATPNRVHRGDVDPFAEARLVANKASEHGPQSMGQGIRECGKQSARLGILPREEHGAPGDKIEDQENHCDHKQKVD